MNRTSLSDPNQGIKEETLESTAKNAFVRKVYSLLLIQIAITVLAVFLTVQYFRGFREFQQDNVWLLLVILIGTVFSGASLSNGIFTQVLEHILEVSLITTCY